jgi:hypothetical protein
MAEPPDETPPEEAGDPNDPEESSHDSSPHANGTQPSADPSRAMPRWKRLERERLAQRMRAIRFRGRR